MCVCMHACTRVCMSLCTHLTLSPIGGERKEVLYIYICVCMHACMYTCMYVSMYASHSLFHRGVRKGGVIYIHMCVCMHACIRVCMYLGTYLTLSPCCMKQGQSALSFCGVSRMLYEGCNRKGGAAYLRGERRGLEERP